jgi:hypothetical protein
MQSTDSKVRGRPQVVIRKVEYCQHCKARMPFRQAQGMVLKGTFHQANAHCKCCGRIAHIRLVECPG